VHIDVEPGVRRLQGDHMTEPYWDPYDIEIDAFPYEHWRRLRDDAPVYRNDEFDFYALSRFEDVERGHREPARYSSAHGTILELMQPQAMTEGGSMISLDPPLHTRLRLLVSRAFTPRRIDALEGRIRELCIGFFDEVGDARSFDYVQDFAARLPAMVIASLFGVPLDQQNDLRHSIDRLFALDENGKPFGTDAIAGMMAASEIITTQIADRRTNPRDDMFTDLVQAEITEADGVTRRLSDSELHSFALLILGAGTETVARNLGWAAVLLDAHPDQRAELVADPTLIPGAMEELLRYEAPSPVQARWLQEDVELHGTVIPKDSKVLLLTGSAGRDEREYPDAERFDIHRRFDRQLSFGYGIHFCLGAALARLEVRVALEETFKRYPTWEVDYDQAERLHTSTVRGYKLVPINV
jgi:cytochrome P450